MLQLADMEISKQQSAVFSALQTGNEALKQAQAEVRQCRGPGGAAAGCLEGGRRYPPAAGWLKVVLDPRRGGGGGSALGSHSAFETSTVYAYMCHACCNMRPWSFGSSSAWFSACRHAQLGVCWCHSPPSSQPPVPFLWCCSDVTGRHPEAHGRYR